MLWCFDCPIIWCLCLALLSVVFNCGGVFGLTLIMVLVYADMLVSLRGLFGSLDYCFVWLCVVDGC